jgi:hypothetical protein
MPDVNTVAIGAPGNDQCGSEGGKAKVFVWNGAAWVKKGGAICYGHPNDHFGQAVSMPDANTIAVGAPNCSTGYEECGNVIVYKWASGYWTPKGNSIYGEAAFDYCGSSVSMPDAQTVAIGAPGNDGGGFASGHVRVYSWNGNSWVQKGSDINGEGSQSTSGVSVSMPDPVTVAIGSISGKVNNIAAGHVRVFVWNGNGWSKKGATIGGENAGDYFGISVSMPDAYTVAIGAKYNNGGGSNSGHTRVYEWNGSSWVQKGADIDGESAGDQAGWSVSMPDANTVAIGAINNDGNGIASGHVRVYSWNGSAWLQSGVDIDGEAADDFCGHSVSMPTANFVAVGARLNDGNGWNAGHARVFGNLPSSVAAIDPEIKIAISPNPTDGKFLVTGILPGIQPGRLEVLDLFGRILHRLDLPRGSTTQSIDLRLCIVNGMYQVAYTSGSYRATAALVISGR